MSRRSAESKSAPSPRSLRFAPPDPAILVGNEASRTAQDGIAEDRTGGDPHALADGMVGVDLARLVGAFRMIFGGTGVRGG